MAKKDLKYFMRENKDEIVTVPGLASFTDDDGNVLDFEIKVLSQKEITAINEGYRRRSIATDKKGNPLVSGGEVIWKTEKDNAKATRHIIAEALQFPNLHDPDLMKFYNCVDVTEMPMLVFSKPDEFAYVMTAVLRALGLAETPDKDDLEDAKN